MLDSSILQVIIGLIFIYSLFSILVSQINNIITSLLNSRTRHLRAGMERLLTDPVIRAKFFAHPLIRLVHSELPPDQKISAQTAQEIEGAALARLDWIPSELFSQVMLDILAHHAPRSNGRAQGSAPEIAALSPILAGLREINDPNLQKALDVLISAARSIEEAKANLEFWFDTHMNQLSAQYRQKMIWFSLGIGLVLVLLLNVDTIQIARSLWDDPTLRAAVADAAQQSVQTQPTAAPEPTAIPSEVLPPSDDGLAAANAAATPADVIVDDGTILRAQETVTRILGLNLPIGWGYAELARQGVSVCQRSSPPVECQERRNLWLLLPGSLPTGEWIGFLLGKLIGLFITVIAIGQGAPFWFDLLNRLVRGR